MYRIRCKKTFWLPVIGKLEANVVYDEKRVPWADMCALVMRGFAAWEGEAPIQKVIPVVEKVPEKAEAVQAVPKKRRLRKLIDAL